MVIRRMFRTAAVGAMLPPVVWGEIQFVTPGCRLNLADYDVGELRNFVKGGGVLFCSDALYRSTWQLLGQIDYDFGKVKHSFGPYETLVYRW